MFIQSLQMAIRRDSVEWLLKISFQNWIEKEQSIEISILFPHAIDSNLTQLFGPLFDSDFLVLLEVTIVLFGF